MSIAPADQTLVLLPGLDGTGLLFRRFRRALAPNIASIVVSYPGDRAIDYAGLEAVARGFLPKQTPFVLLAESFSGPIALAIAAAPPANLKGLILTCAFARNPRPRLRRLQAFVPLLPIGWVPTALLAWPSLGRFATPSLKLELADALARVSPGVLSQRLCAVLGIDQSTRLGQVTVPVLYLRASEDRLVPRAASALLAAMPQIRFVELEGPHFLLQARPLAVASEADAFLREIAGH